MITRKFIEKVHNAFAALNYNTSKRLDLDEFNKAAIDTLIHCKDLADAVDTIRMFQFCLANWEKIEKIFDKKISLFNEYSFERNSLISVVSDDEAQGTYYITNGINKKLKEIFVAGRSFDESIFMLGFDKGKFTVFDDGDYYMKYSKMSSNKMKLFNKRNECVCDIILSEDLGVYLENNLTPYDLVSYEDVVGIYDRNYIESLASDNLIDTNRMLADIEWDILEKNSDFGVAKLNTYVSGHNLELFLFFAVSTFLAYQRYRQSRRAGMYALTRF